MALTASSLRKWALGVAVAVPGFIVTTIAGQWLVSLLEERGFFDSPSSQVSALIGALNGLVGSSWFPWVAGILAGLSCGFAAGVWLDAKLRNRERPPEAVDDTPARIALAERAEALSRKVFNLLGEYNARHNVAWAEDAQNIVSGDVIRSRSAEIRGQLQVRYADLYEPEVWAIIGQAQKFVSLDTWAIQHTSSGYGIDEVPKMLASLAAQLRLQRDDVPRPDQFERLTRTVERLEAQLRAAKALNPPEPGRGTGGVL